MNDTLATILLRDLVFAYDGRLETQGLALLFRANVAHTVRTPVAPSLHFWAAYLKRHVATMFPKLVKLESPNKTPTT